MKKQVVALILCCMCALAWSEEYETADDGTRFFNAVKTNNITALKKYTKEEPGIWYTNEQNENVLMYAVRMSNEQAVGLLLPLYADTTIIADQNTAGLTILDCAVSQKNPQIRKLIENKVWRELNDPVNFDTLYMLAFSGNTPVRNALAAGNIAVGIKNEAGDTLLTACTGMHRFADNTHDEHYYDDEQNKIRFAQFLLQQHTDINATTERDETALYLAIENGYTTLASLLIDARADLNHQTSYNYRPLLRAEEKENKTVFAKLISAGAALNILDDSGNSVLQHCIYDSKYEYAELLIKAGADVNAQKDDGWSPLYTACNENTTSLAALLIGKGADVNSKNGAEKDHPLSPALYHDNYELVQLLLDNGADVRAKSKNGETVLFSVDAGSAIPLVKLLLDHGADVNAARTTGETPVLYAAYSGRADLLSLYKSYNADFLTADREGNTALHYLIRGAIPETTEVLDMEFVTGHTMPADALDILLAEHLDINAQNKAGQTALMLASEGEFDYPEYVSALLARHAAVNLQDKNKETALMYAIGRPHILRTLLDARPDLNLTDKDDKTALAIAEDWIKQIPSREENVQSAQILRAAQNNATPLRTLPETVLFGYTDQLPEVLAQSKNINETDSSGNTALYYAVLRNDRSSLQLLLSRGADANMRGSRYTPLFLALTEKNNDILADLIAAGADVNAACNDGYSVISPLRQAVGNVSLPGKPNLPAVQALIKAGAAIEWKNSYGETELMYACRQSSPEVVQYLLDSGASIFARAKWDYQVKSIFDVASDKNLPLITAKRDSLFMGKIFHAADNLNLRSNADTGSRKLLTLAKGAPVQVVAAGTPDEYEGISSCWVKISTKPGASDKNGVPVRAGTEGWVFGGYLQ
jgi:ankyrin repeat protein